MDGYQRRGEQERTAMLLGEAALARLQGCRVAVFGLGGVGGEAALALARAGVGALDLCDHDVFALSNLNRQALSDYASLGRSKAEVARERIWAVARHCRVRIFPMFYLPENKQAFPLGEADYILDAIDTVTAKLELAVEAKRLGIPIISCMGTGNKLYPERLRLGDIYETSVCPLAKVMRRELRRRGIEALEVVYSTEVPRKPLAVSGYGDALAGEDAEPSGENAPSKGAGPGDENGLAGENAPAGDNAPSKGAGPGDRNGLAGENAPVGDNTPSDGTNLPQMPYGAAIPGLVKSRGKSVPGSVSFVPPAAGLMMAGRAVRRLAGVE